MKKECTVCGQVKPVEFFAKSKGGKFGVRGNCKDCDKVRNKSYRDANKEKLRGLWRSWYEGNKDYNRDRWLDYYDKNAEGLKEKSRLNKKLNAHKYLTYNAKRRAKKLHATPDWLTTDHLAQIEYFYWLSKDLSRVSGENYHVDHIVPLSNANICGLHVPWNLQILPSDLNLRKANSYAAEA